jgi:hypothetical protein
MLHCKKRLAVFPSPAGMSLTKLSLGANLIIPAQGEFGKGYPGWRRENPLIFFTVYAQSLLETGFFLLRVLWSDNTVVCKK